MTAVTALTLPGRTRAAGPTRAAARDGVLAMLPLAAGLAPFGFAIGATVAESDVNGIGGWALSATIYAGSAQAAAIELLDNGAGLVVILATVAIINTRLLLYGASMAPHWADAPRWYKAVAAYLLVDPTFAVTIDRFEHPDDRHAARAFYLGAACTAWCTWITATAVGVVLGTAIPAGFGLDFVMPLALVGLVASGLRDRHAVTAAGFAAAVAVFAYTLPMNSGLIAAGLVGIAVATMTSRAS